jgi:hypothetical protein
MNASCSWAADLWQRLPLTARRARKRSRREPRAGLSDADVRRAARGDHWPISARLDNEARPARRRYGDRASTPGASIRIMRPTPNNSRFIQINQFWDRTSGLVIARSHCTSRLIRTGLELANCLHADRDLSASSLGQSPSRDEKRLFLSFGGSNGSATVWRWSSTFPNSNSIVASSAE